MKKRDISLDVIRSLACILVVIFHCSNNITNDANIGFYSSLLCIPCIVLFFMCSGYLLLPTKETLFVFIKRRMNRILLPTIAWTFFYLMWHWIDEGSYHG